MSQLRVVVTGATGYVAGQLLPALRARYDLSLLDVRAENRDGEEVEGVAVADVSDPDLDAYREHFQGADAVVHLGYVRAGWSDLDRFDEHMTNIQMAQNVYRLCVEEEISRVVVASSNHATDWNERMLRRRRSGMIDPYDKAYANNLYGWVKDVYEHLGFVFATGRFGDPLEVVQIRIGGPAVKSVEHYKGNARRYKRYLGAYISPRDLQQLFIRSIETEDIRNEDLDGIPYHIFYGISANTRHFWSIGNARQVVGYEPQDDSEVLFADEIRAFLVAGEGREHPGRS